MSQITRIIICVSTVIFLMLSGCELINKSNQETPLARVLGDYLYPSDLAAAIPKGSSEKDSAIIARNYIDTWIRKKLMLNQAEIALSDEQKDFEKKMEEYRSSLLIYSYRQKLLQQKLDTIITDNQINDYYEKNIDNFILSDEIVHAIFVKIPRTAPEISNVRNWTHSGSPEDLDKLEKYCVNFAEKFDVFNNDWIYFDELMKRIPLKISEPARFLMYNKNIETTDAQYHYFVKITDHKTEGDKIPLSLISGDIKSILLNKRKIGFYKNLESKVYNDGLNRNSFEIY